MTPRKSPGSIKNIKKSPEQNTPLTSRELETVAKAVVELGGPHWSEILKLHGTSGTRSKVLRNRKAYQLWYAAAQQFTELKAAGEPLPPWLDLCDPEKSIKSEDDFVISKPSSKKVWTSSEDKALLTGIRQVCGPWWARIISLHGINGSKSHNLAGRTEVELASRARHLWNMCVEKNLPLNGLEFVSPKGLTESGFPSARGWTDEMDKLLIQELDFLEGPNYNMMLSRHGPDGTESTTFALKTYQQLRSRALKLYDFCSGQKRSVPKGLRYARR